MKTVLIYGGSFNPPHYGHLKTALAVQHRFDFQHFIFLPNKASVLKDILPVAAKDRLHMLALLLNDHPEFSIDTREIDRNSPSYMVDTLVSFRKEFGADASITMLLGIDSFLTLNQWHQWQTLPTLCNLLVMKRPGADEQSVETLFPDLASQSCHELGELLHTRCGKIGVFDAGLYPVSSTEIRKLIQQKSTPLAEVPEEIYQYIQQHQLYQ